MAHDEKSLFADFVEESCEDLLRRLADALGVSFTVLDDAMRPILEISGPVVALGAGACDSAIATIETGEDIFGFLKANTRKNLGPLVQSLAADISRRFELEQDMQGMTEDLMQAFDQLNLLYKSSQILRPDENFAVNARRLMEDTTELIDDRLLVLYLPKATDMIWPEKFDYSRSEALAWLRLKPARLHQVFIDLQGAEGVVVAGSESRFQSKIESPRGAIRYIALPLRVRSELRGFVGIFTGPGEESLESGEVRLAETLAEELSNAATTQELNLELRQLLFNVVRSLVAAIEAKDNYTRGHSDRVVRFSVQIAKSLGLPEDEIQVLSWAALLHDIGKISIEDEILHKPGKLTAEEYEIIKGHPETGARMLEPITQLYAILPAIRHHHERFDGGGYPDGLEGESIPLLARIIAVADTYDSIVTTRPYRGEQPRARALQVIGEGAGSQFDPGVAAAFLELAAGGGLGHLASEVPVPVEG